MRPVWPVHVHTLVGAAGAVRPVRGLYGPEYSTQINRELRTQVPDTVTSKSLLSINKRQGPLQGHIGL